MTAITFRATVLTLAWLAVASLPAAAQSDVSLSFANGRVTLVATGAPLSRVLAEWQRLGGTRFVNTDRLPGTAVTITLTDVPERQALAILLRPYSGYMASPGTGGNRAASVLKVVLVMPTLARANPVATPAGTNAAGQAPVQPRPMNRGFGRPGMPGGGDPDVDPSDPNMGTDPDMPETPPPGLMGMPNYPGMPTAPTQDPTSAQPDPASPGVPGTAPVPGMMVPVPPTPGTGPPRLPPKPPGRGVLPDAAQP